MPKSKAKMMQKLRKSRRDKGLEPVTCHVKPEHKDRLKNYVKSTLKGEIGS